MVRLTRFQSDQRCTLGRLEMPSGWSCYILELPWRDNEQSVSCIPDGEYPIRKRRSGVVERTTGGEYTEGYEIQRVPGRTYIMLHPGNWPGHTEGCLLPGQEPRVMRGELGVPNSMPTFRQLMEQLDGLSDHSRRIRITWQLDEFPRYGD